MLFTSDPGLFPDDPTIFDVHDAIGERQDTRIVGYDQHPAGLVLGDLGEQGHDGLTVLSVERAGRFVRKNRRCIPHDGPRDRHALLLAAAELNGKRFRLVGQADHGERFPCRDLGASGSLSAHIQRQPDIVLSRQGGKQMVGLKDETDVIAPEFGEVLRPRPGGRSAVKANNSVRRRHQASHDREQRGLAAPRWSHQKDQLTAVERQAYAFERLYFAGAAAKAFDDVDSIDQRLRHRVNTRAGSIRMTCAMAAMADAIHMTTVNTSSPTVNAGVTTIGDADSAVILTTMAPMAAAPQKPMTALSSACQMMTM